MIQLRRLIGVEVPDEKTVAHQPLAEIPPPQFLHVPLVQHNGAAGELGVKKGDTVRIGDPLTIANEPNQIPVHSPVSGVVRLIGEGTLPCGEVGTVIKIENDGNDERRETEARPSLADYSRENILRVVREAGIVGMGGGVYPTVLKLMPKNPVDTVILNGCEGEPILSCDYRIMLEETEKLLFGGQALQKALSAEQLIIAVEDNKLDCAQHLRKTAADRVKVVVVPSTYPVSAENQLTAAVTGRNVPRGGRPADVGVVVFNVHTAAAVGDALKTGAPLTRRAITVAGGAVQNSGNYWVRVGTLVEDVLNYVGCDNPRQVLMGGPMMGQSLPVLDVPVVKGTTGIIAMLDSEVDAKRPLPCVSCGSCIDACPVGLAPVRLVSHIIRKEFAQAAAWRLGQCMECGACAFACPSHIPLVQWLKTGKATLRKEGR